MVALTAGAYAYDSSRSDRVVEGVTVAGVDLGGLHRDAARRKLEAELTQRLERPVRVAVAGRRFRLTVEQAGARPDVDAMVDEAIDKSRRGWLLGRVFRGLRGQHLSTELPARVTYSSQAVERFVQEVRRAVDRAPRDARLELQAASLPVVPSRTGLRLRARRLRVGVENALSGIGHARFVRAHTRIRQPKVTTRELARKYPDFITIDRPAFRLRLFRKLELAKTYTIAVGRVGLETPAGLYHIESKSVNPSWHVPKSAWAGDLAGRVIPPGPDNPIKARWMGIFDGAGIHGTEDLGSLGTAASHGCIRMSIPDVEALYDRVPLRTPVFVK
jgi:lipoprotein-anchoring transpeptidase ErfK/SrfK